MRQLAIVAVALTVALTVAGGTSAQTPPRASVAPRAMQALTPGLATYTDEVLFGDVWVRPDLSPRDRSLVVVSTLIATGKTAQLEGHLGRALANGVQPGEAAAIVTHLAFYAGWPSAVSALDVYEKVFAARGVDLAALRAAAGGSRTSGPTSAPAEPAASPGLAAVAPKFVQITQDVVAGDLWRRTDLTPRDRSLVTIAALAAMGEDEQLELYLRRGLDAGLTRAQVAEALTHLAFYAGLSRATRALQVLASIPTESAEPVGGSATRGAAGNFTGDVWVAGAFRGTGGARLGGATVTFAPAARTRWHSHPLGQLLVVTTGRGWMQIEGQPVRSLRPGDVVWTPPGAKHWHGGTGTSGLTHVAVAETEEGASVTWLEPVSDAQFRGPQ